jgi:hypothetical protein
MRYIQRIIYGMTDEGHKKYNSGVNTGRYTNILVSASESMIRRVLRVV